jgi:NuA3 HAT complex component NTO1
VSKNDAPDYYDIIKKPMCWKTIDGKLDRDEYWNLQDYKVWLPFSANGKS